MSFRAVTLDVGGVLRIGGESAFNRWEARLGLPEGSVEAIHLDPAVQQVWTQVVPEKPLSRSTWQA